MLGIEPELKASSVLGTRPATELAAPTMGFWDAEQEGIEQKLWDTARQA